MGVFSQDFKVYSAQVAICHGDGAIRAILLTPMCTVSHDASPAHMRDFAARGIGYGPACLVHDALGDNARTWKTCVWWSEYAAHTGTRLNALRPIDLTHNRRHRGHALSF